MRNLIAIIALLLSACSTTVDFAIASDAPVQVRYSSVEQQLKPGDPAFQEMADWIARNQKGWSQSSATNPANGIFVSSGQWRLQFVGTSVYLHTESGMLTKQVKESEYAFLRVPAGA